MQATTKKTIRSFLAAAALISVAPLMMLQACAQQGVLDDEIGDDNGGDKSQPPAEAAEQGGICLLNNCNSDLECAGCDDGRDSCLIDENRCVACDPVSGHGCGPGETCSPFGLCAPEGQTCLTDEHGDPTVSCASDTDCKACSPMHQVCDVASGKCQACTASDTSHCLQSDICISGKCSPKCPTACTADAECGQCGGPGNEAHACNSHKCAECSDTFPCPEGLQCQAGSCVPGCGIPGPVSGDCTADEDCKFCGDGEASVFVCKKAINSNPNDHGSCVPKAEGCSDLGKEVAVLPEPWNAATNLCSSDANCAGQGITYNVGKMIRELVGSEEINLGFKKIKIQDANVQYAMPKCANIDITDSISCGICVPCQQDADCAPIQVDPLINDLFKGDPLAQIAGALLIDLLYGDTPEHALNFFCQPVAAGYGVCAPCANPLQKCGQSGGNNNGGGNNGGGNNGGGTCSHDVCDTGSALSCNDSCVQAVCAADSYCCDTAWDSVCVNEVAQYCGPNTCSGGGNNGGGNNNGCAHSECTSGGKLADGCSTCAGAVCAQDPFCCNNEWDSLCVDAAKAEASCGC